MKQNIADLPAWKQKDIMLYGTAIAKRTHDDKFNGVIAEIRVDPETFTLHE